MVPEVVRVINAIPKCLVASFQPSLELAHESCGDK